MQQQTILNKKTRNSLFLSAFSFIFLFFVGVGSIRAQTFVSPSEAKPLLSTKITQLTKNANASSLSTLERVQLERKILMYKTIGVYVDQTSNVAVAIKAGLRTAYGPMVGQAPGLEATKAEMLDAEVEATATLSN